MHHHPPPAPTPGRPAKKCPRATGDNRTALTAALTRRHQDGHSIRRIVRDTRLSHSYLRRLPPDADVTITQDPTDATTPGDARRPQARSTLPAATPEATP
ncbi:hypothetical protein EDC02_2276 [Micromonospora sp. Llam0]|uniref:helix-turn-helix domain-containing protein n=1 Tax=Micromonospora sp. Llam0 TaxID=2485143 RepID=UPI000F46017C|nr:hypothetical protein [Micromonospora sp. Llam0]ROO60410.1 hypothetical protein EDC02_2276 [Micromonospora sp. Llam0]